MPTEAEFEEKLDILFIKIIMYLLLLSLLFIHFFFLLLLLINFKYYICIIYLLFMYDLFIYFFQQISFEQLGIVFSYKWIFPKHVCLNFEVIY